MGRRAVSILFGLLIVASACTRTEGDRGQGTAVAAGPWRGGTLRIVDWLAGGWLDPAGTPAGTGTGAELLRCCLARTLISYEGVPAQEGGSEPRPDLTDGMPDVSADGLTWTFHLRDGVRYGPPFEETEVVASDVVRALHRVADPAVGSPYASYFSMIEGFDDVRAGRAATISGLEVPDPHVLVVRLTRPAGDLAYRFSLPATAPIPAGAADGHRNYGPFIVSTGPYMLEGAGALDFTLPVDRQEPASGYTPETITLVRNPSWDAANDPLRPAYVDSIVIANHAPEFEQLLTSGGDFSELFNDFYYSVQAEDARAIDEGTADLSLSGLPAAEQVLRYQADPALRSHLIGGTLNRTYYWPFNLAVPPFDDLHVRRAVSLAIDRTRAVAFIEEDPDWFGPELTSHIAPDGTEAFLLASFRPTWRSVGDEGDVAAARAEMRLSSYDRDRDGRCDAPACRGVEILVERSEQELHPWSELVTNALGSVGITPRVRVLGYGEGILQQMKDPSAGWGFLFCVYCNWVAVDFPGASSVFMPMLHGPSITDRKNTNLSLLGATPEQLERWRYGVDEVPSIDERIEACQRVTGFEQTECWAELDQFVMDEIVPWVPFVSQEAAFPVSERVADGSLDERTGYPALDRISLVLGSG